MTARNIYPHKSNNYYILYYYILVYSAKLYVNVFVVEGGGDRNAKNNYTKVHLKVLHK